MPLNEPRSLNKGATSTTYQHTVNGMRCKSREEHFPDSHSWGRARQLIWQTYVNLHRDRNRKPAQMADAGAKRQRVRRVYPHIGLSWSKQLSVYSRCLRQYCSSYGTWKPGMAPQGRGKQSAKIAVSHASLGCWKKQMPSCYEMDTDYSLSAAKAG